MAAQPSSSRPVASSSSDVSGERIAEPDIPNTPDAVHNLLLEQSRIMPQNPWFTDVDSWSDCILAAFKLESARMMVTDRETFLVFKRKAKTIHGVFEVSVKLKILEVKWSGEPMKAKRVALSSLEECSAFFRELWPDKLNELGISSSEAATAVVLAAWVDRSPLSAVQGAVGWSGGTSGEGGFMFSRGVRLGRTTPMCVKQQLPGKMEIVVPIRNGVGLAWRVRKVIVEFGIVKLVVDSRVIHYMSSGGLKGRPVRGPFVAEQWWIGAND